MNAPGLPASEDLPFSVSRYSSMPVKDLLRGRMKDLGITNLDLQKALGYARPNVIAMMRSGSMRLPANKVVATAQLLQVDPVFLLSKVITENDPALWPVISSLLGGELVTVNESALVQMVRQSLDGHDVNLAEEVDFAKTIAPLLEQIAQRETARVRATLPLQDEEACAAPSVGTPVN